jgi:hypothetical protein
MALLCASLPATARGDAPEQPQSAPQSQEKRVDATTDAGAAPTVSPYRLLDDGNWTDPSQCAVRFGYWGTQTSGSPVKVGEYQNLGASPFYDFDGLSTDGHRTANYTITGTDAETNAANLNYYQPGSEANISFQRFPHQLGHENLGEFPDANQNITGINSAQQFRRQDVNAGEDSAVRVEELKANFKYQVNDVLKVRLDVWGYYKEGERQVNAMQECYAHTNGVIPNTVTPPATISKNCHVLSQMQHIDWRTTEVKPVVELNLGSVVFEYSRPMRVFSENDQDVFRFYDSGGTAASEFGSPRYMEYGVVPDSITQTDQLKMNANLNDCNKLYGFLFAGNTRKESDIVAPIPVAGGPAFVAPADDERVSNRQFSGADVRWTNTSIKNVTITTYARTVGENNEPAAFLIPGEETRPGTSVSNPAIEDNPLLITPINYQRTQYGTKAVWRPFGGGFGLGGFAINGGYEYSGTHRVGLEVDTGSDDPPFQGTIIEENTISQTITIGPSMRWSPELDTYIRYKWCNTRDPLFATNSHEAASGASFDYQALSLNSALPTHSDFVEIGGTLMPSDRFLLNAWFGIDIQSQDIGVAQVVPGTQTATTLVTALNASAGFASQSFPFGINGSYRATDKWTLSGGAAYYTDFINQDVAFGAGADHTFSGTATPYGLLQNQWGYASRASVFNLGTTYDITPKVRLTGQAEYVKGIQSAVQTAGDPRFAATNIANTATAGIPQYLREDVVTTRVSAGIDYQFAKHWSTYFRYVLYVYEDNANQDQIAASISPVTGLPLSGISNMFLGGVTGTF